MKPSHVLLSYENGVNVPTVEFHADSCSYLTNSDPGGCQCDWKQERHQELAATNKIDAIVNARILAKQLDIPCRA